VHNLYAKATDGSGEVERLTVSPQHQDPGSWSPDGRYLVFAEDNPETAWDIWLLDMAASPPEPRPLIRTRVAEHSPVISPDGRWLAYVSTESGRRQVYVTRFPNPGGRQQVSREVGHEPLWSPVGDELFYASGDQQTGCSESERARCVVTVWAVDVRLDPELRLGIPRALFAGGSTVRSGYGWPRYHVTRDGRRFLIPRRGLRQPASVEFVVVLNWFEELKRRVPGG
jgi:dipeptidyl aminopeptidase/acylaminoacyl peptidase